MTAWPNLFALYGSPCQILSEQELDVLYNSASMTSPSTTTDVIHDMADRKDCHCELCYGQNCTLHWGSTQKCLGVVNSIAEDETECPQLLNLDDPKYKDLTVTIAPQYRQGYERQSSRGSSDIDLSNSTVFWLFVSTCFLLSFVVRRHSNFRFTGGGTAYRRRTSTADGRGGTLRQFIMMIGMQKDDDDGGGGGGGGGGAELDPFFSASSMELATILEDRPICTPFHLRK
ncbi:MAG: hypothetical protein SGBAC_007472 [Bacillariaceae sp.]